MSFRKASAPVRMALGLMMCVSSIAGSVAFGYSFRQLTPYGFIQGGGNLGCFYPLPILPIPMKIKGPPSLLFGGGVLLNPDHLDDWLMSVEGLGHIISRSSLNEKRNGYGAILMRSTWPISENKDVFAGVGLGYGGNSVYREEKPSQLSFIKGFAVVAHAGGNYHVGRGFYLSTRLAYFRLLSSPDPISDTRDGAYHSDWGRFFLNMGLQINLA